jgi:hypothetical protein
MKFHLTIFPRNIPDVEESIVSTLFSLFQIGATNYCVIIKRWRMKGGKEQYDF